MPRFSATRSSDGSSGCSCSSERDGDAEKPSSVLRKDRRRRAPAATAAAATHPPRPLAPPLPPPPPPTPQQQQQQRRRANASSSSPHGMSANEFRDTLHARVIRSGMLDDVKARMRAALIYHLASDAASGGRGSSFSAELLAGRCSSTSERNDCKGGGGAPSTSSLSSLYSRAADVLVAQHLRATGRELSLSVFVPEARLNAESGSLFSLSSSGLKDDDTTFDELASLCRLGSTLASSSSAWPRLSRAIENKRISGGGCGSFALELLEALATTFEEEERGEAPPPEATPAASAAASVDDAENDNSPSTALLLRQLEEARDIASRFRRRELRWKDAALAAEAALDEALEAGSRGRRGAARRRLQRDGGVATAAGAASELELKRK